MRTTILSVFLLTLISAHADIRVLEDETQYVFAGGSRTVRVVFQNQGDKSAAIKLRTRLFQESSATLMPLGDAKDWKSINLATNQMVIEEVSATFPDVRVATSFQLRFFDEKEHLLGRMEIRVVPQTILNELAKLTPEKTVGIIDPEQQLAPLLKQAGVGFQDLEGGTGFGDFEGSLVIVGPFSSRDVVPGNLRERITDQKRPLKIVWILPTNERPDPLLPIYLTRENQAMVAVVQAAAVARLKDSAKAQLVLTRAAALAAKPELLTLPGSGAR